MAMKRKTKTGGYPAICSTCHEPIDLGIVSGKARANKRYLHPCGRVLVRGPKVAGGERLSGDAAAAGNSRPASPPASSLEKK